MGMLHLLRLLRQPLTTLGALLLCFVCWVPLELYLIGTPFAIVFLLAFSQESKERKLAYAALASAILVLTFAPINTDLSNPHFVVLSVCFLLALLLPAIILRKTEPKIISFHLWPKHVDWVDISYTALSIPLAYVGINFYFKILSPEVAYNWVQPPSPDNEQLFRLFMGINGVGIWDELFFVNTSFAILRYLFPYWTANIAQAVIYTGTLWDMAFRGTGFVLVYIFAITQGAMYERSKVLLWVLIVHLIVDFFLFQTIIDIYYPDLDVWWH